MFMQVVVQIVLEKITDKLGHGRSIRTHIFGSQFGLGLTLEDRLLYLDADGSHDTRPNVGIFEVLVVELHLGWCADRSRRSNTLLHTGYCG